MALTDARIRTLKPAKGRADVLVADGNGLYIRCRLGQADDITRTWQFRRKQDGKVHIRTLGTYPALSLKQARLKAAGLSNKRSDDGITVKDAAERWLREQVDPRHRQGDQYRGYVERAIIPELGRTRIADVEARDIADMVRKYRDHIAKSKKARTGGRPAAAALLSVTKTLFRYAVANGMIATSPARDLTQALVGPPPVARERVLNDEEILFVMRTQHPAGPVLRFLLATGMRLGEAYNGARHGQYWVVPSSASKNKREHRVWLSVLALAQLEAHPWGEPRHEVQRFVTRAKAGWTVHDLRRTFATRNHDMGVPPHIVEKMLNHSFDGVMAVYNRATYDDERQKALETWGAWLGQLVGARPARVVPLRRSAS